jgi:hypothetical protein
MFSLSDSTQFVEITPEQLYEVRSHPPVTADAHPEHLEN